MSVGNYNSIAISVGNKKKPIPTELPTELQTDKRAKIKFPPPSYRRNISVCKIQR
jgi:hypothetical protein